MLDDARTLVAAVEELTGAAVARAKEITNSGKAIDDHQVLSERVAYAATEARAARELVSFVGALAKPDEHLTRVAAASAMLRDRHLRLIHRAAAVHRGT